MSFQNSCKAQTISGETLTKCTETTTGEFCDQHKHKYRLEKPDECPVCFDEVSSETETPLECGHWFHKKCLQPTNLHKCFVCQTKMTDDETTFIFGEGHVEQNNFNDGETIFWHASQDDDNAYAEFGHGDNQDDDDAFQDVDDDDRLSLLNFDENDVSREEIDNAIESLSDNTLTMIFDDISNKQLDSEFIQKSNIMTIVPVDEEELMLEFINDFISTEVTIHFNHENKHAPQNVFSHEIDECISIVHDRLSQNDEILLFTLMCWNFETSKCVIRLHRIWRLITEMMKNLIIDELDNLRTN